MKESPYKEGLTYEELMIYKSFNLSGYPWEAGVSLLLWVLR